MWKSWLTRRMSVVFLGTIVLILLKSTIGLSQEEVVGPVVTNKVFFDMAYAGEPIGRVVVGLFGEIVPKTVKDFVKLADGTFEENGRFYSYKETSFDQIVKGFVIAGGHISVQKRNRGLQRPLFPNENFKLKHYGAGFLSLTNAGQNNPRFCIMLAKADHWDGKHIVFGKVLEGMGVVRRMENVPTNTQAPIVDISVTDCGSLPLERHFAVSIRPVVE